MVRSSTMKKTHSLENIWFEDDHLILSIDGTERRFALHEVSPALKKASKRERNTFEVTPSGYGIHWPLLDEDLSIDGLIGIIHAPSRIRKIA